MKVLVCGTRHFKDPFRANLVIDERIKQLPLCTVIHGGALGADRMAAEAAARCGLVVVAFLPNYERDGARAPLVRNIIMLEERPDLVLAFWDRGSTGTAHTIVEAGRRKIPVEIIALK